MREAYHAPSSSRIIAIEPKIDPQRLNRRDQAPLFKGGSNESLSWFGWHDCNIDLRGHPHHGPSGNRQAAKSGAQQGTSSADDSDESATTQRPTTRALAIPRFK